MKRDELVDFFVVHDHHLEIHGRLENWSRWVRIKMVSKQHPMWAKSHSNTRQWHAPEPREATDTLDAQRLEKAVFLLPMKQRDAIRWNYVWCGGPLHMARKLGVSRQGLLELVREGRQMLLNRGA